MKFVFGLLVVSIACAKAQQPIFGQPLFGQPLVQQPVQVVQQPIAQKTPAQQPLSQFQIQDRVIQTFPINLSS